MRKITEGDFYDPILENIISKTNDKNEKDFILEYSHLNKNLNIESDIKIIELKRSSLSLSKKMGFLSSDDMSLSLKYVIDNSIIYI